MDDSAKFWTHMKSSKAVWEHSGDPRAPHARLRNGCCTNGFIDSLQYLSGTVNLDFATEAMADKLTAKLGGKNVDWVFGSPMAGIPFATLVGVKMGVPRVGFTEKAGANNKDQICRFDIPRGSIILDVEEMTTSGETPQRVIDAVMKKNPSTESLPFVGAFLIRCEHKPAALGGKELVPLVDLPELGISYSSWGAECPLCAAGSRVVTNVKKVWLDFLRTMEDPTHIIPGVEYK